MPSQHESKMNGDCCVFKPLQGSLDGNIFLRFIPFLNYFGAVWTGPEPSCGSPGSDCDFAVTFCFCFLRHRGSVKHIEVKRGQDGCFGFAVNYTTYPTLVDLVRYYHENTLQVHNSELDTTLKFPLGSFVGRNS